MALKQRKLKLLWMLLPLPLVWVFVGTSPFVEAFMGPLENLAMDWRFMARGPREVPRLKLIYANIDAQTTAEFGERPYPRAHYARFTRNLFEVAKVKAVGLDLVLSPLLYSPMVSVEAIQENDLIMAQAVSRYPNLVLAANYSRARMPLTLNEREDLLETGIADVRLRRFPYRYKGIPQPSETFPEAPSYPIAGPAEMDRGQVGLIDWDDQRNPDASPRWIALFADIQGPYRFLDQLDGILRFNRIPLDNFGEPTPEREEDYFKNGFYAFFDDSVFFFGPGGGPLLRSDGLPVEALKPETVDTQMYAFSLELALRYLDLPRTGVELKKDRLVVRNQAGDPVIDAPLTDQQMIEVNWFSPWHDTRYGAYLDNLYNPQASLIEISLHMENLRSGTDPQLKAEAQAFLKPFEGAVVIIAPEEILLQDLAPSPFDSTEVPKAGLHGNALKTLVSGLYISRAPEWVEILAILLLTPAVTALGVYSGPYSRLAKMGSIGLIFLYIGAVFAAFSTFHLVLPLVTPVVSSLTTVTVGILYQLLDEERRRARIKNTFGTYIPKTLVNRFVESGEEPRLGGELAEISIFFSDVQGFSGFSEVLSPEELVQLMNEYLGAMTEILESQGGVLDKYIGDAIVAMFGAPLPLENHAAVACRVAALIQIRQQELREKWRSEGKRWPEIVSQMRTRIGINTGKAIVGNMGSEGRYNYTMMGDDVNLAARCESGAKSAGVYTLVTRTTRDAAVAVTSDLAFRYIDRWQVKGRLQPVEMYEVMGLVDRLPMGALECIQVYERGMQYYFSREFAQALNCFNIAATLEPIQPGRDLNASDNPSMILARRCQEYLDNPPPESWDGVYRMKSK